LLSVDRRHGGNPLREEQTLRAGAQRAGRERPFAVWEQDGKPTSPGGATGDSNEIFPYRFDPRANAVVRIIFPKTVIPSGYSKAYLDRARPMEFASKDEVLRYHPASINAGSATAEPYEKAYLATESVWRSAHAADGRARQLFKQVKAIAGLARGMANDRSKPSKIIEKALWHRDLVCSLQAILHCEDMADKTVPAKGWNSAKTALMDCLQSVVFSEAEYNELERQLPIVVSPKHFKQTCRLELTDDYLPPVVLARPANWYELPSDEDPGLHFQAYGGRNFTRAFMMVPGMSEREFLEYWTKVTKQFGMNVTVSAAVPRLPAGTQTVLLRTFGVFLDDGSYADSRIPEEVLVRIFKYQQATLDPSTSDGLGTLHYQYKLRRNRLLTLPQTLGLERIHDADGQFYGFFAEVPEPDSTGHLTTMRANCISCHSEALYGASTIFSLCRHKPVKPQPSRWEGGQMERMGRCGWRIKEDALQTIQKELMNRLKPAH
jgi:hypothetical protein